MMPAHSVRGARLSTWNPHPRCDLLARAGEVFDLRQIADSRNDILAAAAGITAGSWTPGRPPMSATSGSPPGCSFSPEGGRGFPFDYDELERLTRVGYERVMRSRKRER
jgi:hypothetical protein